MGISLMLKVFLDMHVNNTLKAAIDKISEMMNKLI